MAKLLLLLSCQSCTSAPVMAAMPLPLQLKSWKGCIAELMAQPKFRVSLLRTMEFQSGKRGMGLIILMSLQSTAWCIICTLTELHRCCTFKHPLRLLLLSLACLCAVQFCSILLVVI